MKPTLFLIVLLTACLTTEPQSFDSGPPVQESPDKFIDSGYGLGLGEECIPTIDDCQASLTCQPRGAHDGVCSIAGPVPAGGACEAMAECGQRMACVQDELGQGRCRVVCDSLAPEARCSSLERCAPMWGETGVCLP